MAALRRPTLMTWFVCAPRSRIFGSVAEVIHYNCRSRMISAFANKIFGIPILAYCDDLGALSPERVALPALQACQSFSALVGYLLKIIKTDIGREVTFLGFLGKFPIPENDMALEIALPMEKATAWSARIGRFLELGVITPTEIDSLIGRLSFSKTSVFGRFGRPFLPHLYAKKKRPLLLTNPVWSRTTCPTLAEHNDKTIETAKDNNQTRQTGICRFPRRNNKGHHYCCNRFRTKYHRGSEAITMVWGETVGPHWETLFDKTSLIYGLEMLALLALLWTPNPPFREKQRPST